MAPSLPAIFLAIIVVVVGSAWSTTVVQEVDIVGVVNPLKPRCTDAQACSLELDGPHVNITHGDGTQSCLWLICQPDNYILVLGSTMATRYARMKVVGMTGSEQGANCDEEMYYSDEVVDGSNPKGPQAVGYQRMQKIFRYPSCGAVSSRRNADEPESARNRLYENKVRLLEFVHPDGLLVGSRQDSIYLTSETIVNYKCCISTATDEGQGAVCPEPEPVPPVLLQDCTHKNFSINCWEDHEKEVYQCTVGITEPSTFGTNQVGFYVDQCHAEIGGNSVLLYDNNRAVKPNRDLEVRAFTLEGTHPDRTQFRIQTAYLVDDSHADDVDPVPVRINCNVKVAHHDDLSGHYATSAEDQQVVDTADFRPRFAEGNRVVQSSINFIKS